MEQVPTPAEIVGRLEPVTKQLRRVLRKSVGRAKRFLDAPGREWDSFYFATRIRYEARQLLKAEGLEVSEDTDETSTPEIESNKLPNIGLQFFHDGLLTKVLKRSLDADMPMPIPSSRKRISFYNQQSQIVPHPKLKDLLRFSEWNALYLWDCNAKHEFARLSIALPKTGGRAKPDVSYHWIAEIPLVSSIRDFDATYNRDREQLPFEDLDIRRPEDDLDTGANDAT